MARHETGGECVTTWSAGKYKVNGMAWMRGQRATEAWRGSKVLDAENGAKAAVPEVQIVAHRLEAHGRRRPRARRRRHVPAPITLHQSGASGRQLLVLESLGVGDELEEAAGEVEDLDAAVPRVPHEDVPEGVHADAGRVREGPRRRPLAPHLNSGPPLCPQPAQVDSER